MDSFELNKIIAAVLMVALLIIGIGKVSKIIFHVEKPKKPGYVVEIQETTEVSTVSTEPIEDKVDIATLMALGDVASGEKIFKKCAACHSIVKGGKNNIGPALYNVFLCYERFRKNRLVNFINLCCLCSIETGKI